MILNNPKHEAFATHIAAGLNRTQAAIKVGYSKACAPNFGSRLMRIESVAARVEELRTPGSYVGDPAAMGDRPWIKSKLIEVVQIGMHKDTRDLSNANRALEGLTKLGGFAITETRSIKETHKFDHTSEPSHIVEYLKQQYGALSTLERETLRLSDPSVIDAIVEAEEL